LSDLAGATRPWSLRLLVALVRSPSLSGAALTSLLAGDDA